MTTHAPDEQRTVPLTARIEADLQAEIDRNADADSKPGAMVTRSQMVRVLLWEAVNARKATAAREA
jgi:hypothetical protein